MTSASSKSTPKKPTLILNKLAALISVAVGMSAMIIGGQVLLGKVPEHYVVDWMVPLQFMFGVFSATFVAFLIWKDNFLAMIAVFSMLSLHVLVIVILLTGYGNVVAYQTINMTTIRIGTWVVITVLMLLHQRQKRKWY